MNACNAEHQQLVDDCEAREGRLSDWERDFVDSMIGDQDPARRQELHDGERS